MEPLVVLQSLLRSETLATETADLGLLSCVNPVVLLKTGLTSGFIITNLTETFIIFVEHVLLMLVEHVKQELCSVL